MRSPVLMIATGAQEIGKSYTSLKEAIYIAYISPNKRKTLIYDTSNEYGEYEIDGIKHKIKALDHNQIIAFSNQPTVEVRRIVPFHPNGMPFDDVQAEALLIKVLKEGRGMEIIVEDLSNIFGDSLPKAVTGAFCTVRHRNADCVAHLQSVARILPKLLQNTKIVRYHYQIDSISNSKDKLGDEYELFSIVEKLVNKQFLSGNKYFYVLIYRMVKRVQGQFSEKMFADAVREYVYDHPSSTSSLEKRRDGSGKKIYNYAEAVQLKTRELFDKYYGNHLQLK